jgi:hypothetical protein
MELEGMQNKAVMVCFSKSIIGSSEEDDEKYKGSQLPGEYWNPERRRTYIYYLFYY